jgi:hypothetical protein
MLSTCPDRVYVLAAAALVSSLACDPDDTGWREAFDATEVGWFLNTWGPGPGTLYVVGGEPTAGTVMHFDGDDWAAVDLGLDVPLLNWSWGFGPDDLTVVGNDGTVLHHDGSAWTAQDTPTDEDLWGVWGASPDDLWAVGGRGRPSSTATILHYDGSAWTAVEPPALQRANVHAFFKVWGTAADNVYIVGQRGVVLHWDGSTWTELLVGASDDLVSIWGTGPDHIVAVGGRASGIVSRWDGASWRTESLSPLPGLNGVWMGDQDPDTVYIAGAVGTVATLDFDTLEYQQESAGTTLDFHNVFSPDGITLYAVGGNLLTAQAPYQGIAYRREIEEGQ